MSGVANPLANGLRILLIQSAIWFPGMINPASLAGQSGAASAAERSFPFIATGLPSAVEVDRPWWGAAPSICRHLRLAARDTTLVNVVVTTKGLGDVMLSKASSSDTTCSASAGESTILALDSVGPGPVDVRVRIIADSVARHDVSLDGQVRVLPSRAATIELPLRIQPPAERNPFFTAVLWVLGIAIPAWIGYIVFVLQERRRRRIEREDAFRTFVYKEWNDLRDSLNEFIGTLERDVTDAGEFAASLHTELQRRRVFENLPEARRVKLLETLRGNSRAAMLEIVRQSFPPEILRTSATNTRGSNGR
jgi:hypothetical protein